MFLVKSAWDNIVFHKKRSILSILLITIASGAVLLFRGYVEYSEWGLSLGFIENSGHIQIAAKGSWESANNESSYLDAANLAALKAVYETISEVKTSDAVLNFQGIIGTGNTSTVFWASGYDNPQKLGATEGDPVFDDEENFVLGEGLFKLLDINLQTEPFVNIMSSIGSSGILTGSFAVSGWIDTGIPQNDKGFVIASRSALLRFFELEDSASYIRLYLKKDSDVAKVQKELNDYFAEYNLPYETRNWKELNPSYGQISGMFNSQFFVISIILCTLIFVALTQSLSASFMERLGEFGTIEAIGMKKSSVVILLICEVCIVSLAGIAGGLLLYKAGNILTETFQIKLYPPGYNKGYQLNFYISYYSAFLAQFFIFCTCLIAVIYPIYTIKKNNSLRLMNYSGA